MVFFYVSVVPGGSRVAGRACRLFAKPLGWEFQRIGGKISIRGHSVTCSGKGPARIGHDSTPSELVSLLRSRGRGRYERWYAAAARVRGYQRSASLASTSLSGEAFRNSANAFGTAVVIGATRPASGRKANVSLAEVYCRLRITRTPIGIGHGSTITRFGTFAAVAEARLTPLIFIAG